MPGRDGRPVARFATWPGGVVEVATGGHLQAEGRLFRVRVTFLGDPGRGVPGVVELATTPAA